MLSAAHDASLLVQAPLPSVHGTVSDQISQFRLLCDALSAPGEDAHRRIATAISQPEGIAAIVRMAEQERVLPALHEAMLAYGGLVPKAWRAVLATQHEANRRRNTLARRALVALAEAGAQQGLELVALKGATWVLEDPGNAPWRTLIDLDVLVRPEQLDAVPALLEQLGYQRASRSSRFRDNFHLAPYRGRDVPMTLEVHRHVGWRHWLLPPDVVREGARAVAPGLLLPVPWVRAFHAMIHWQIQDHGGSRQTLPLKDVLEIAHFMSRSDVDWAALSRHAARVGTTDACARAVAAAAMLLHAPIPREVVPGPAARRWVERAVARRASPLRTWLATQIWRAGTLWHCDKVRYRCALRGFTAPGIALAVWGARIVRLPLLAVRAAGIGAGLLIRWSRGAASPRQE